MRTRKLFEQDNKNFEVNISYKEASENKTIITNNNAVTFPYLIVLSKRLREEVRDSVLSVLFH